MCIVQDDLDDWARESAIMGDICAGAFCTLAARSIVYDVDNGFLESALRSPFRARAVIATQGLGSQMVCVNGILLGSFEVEMNNSPLNRRGWILRERLLSPITIHFTSSRLYLENRWENSIVCEDTSNVSISSMLRAPGLSAEPEEMPPWLVQNCD